VTAPQPDTSGWLRWKRSPTRSATSTRRWPEWSDHITTWSPRVGGRVAKRSCASSSVRSVTWFARMSRRPVPEVLLCSPASRPASTQDPATSRAQTPRPGPNRRSKPLH